MGKHVSILASLIVSVVCATAASSLVANAAATVRNIAELNASAVASNAKSVRFDITARITLPGIPGKRSFVAEDGTGATRLGTNPSISHLCPTNAGDIVRIVGVTSPSPSRNRKFESPEIEHMLENDPPVPELSPRQRDILESITRGLTNAQIALQLDISPESVKTHIAKLFEKLGAASRSEAIAIALRRHLLKI